MGLLFSSHLRGTIGPMALVENRKARFNYEILEEYEAGLVLSGGEVKSLKKGHGSLDGAFVSVRNNLPTIVGMHISPYQPKNSKTDFNERRERALLFSKKEIQELSEQSKNQGLTLIPLSIYIKGKRIKLKVGLARGKKKFDKRESIKKREANRDIERGLSRR